MIANIDVKKLRQDLRLTQEQFSEAFEIELATLRDWEQERRSPRGPTLVLLNIIARAPGTVRHLVQQSRAA